VKPERTPAGAVVQKSRCSGVCRCIRTVCISASVTPGLRHVWYTQTLTLLLTTELTTGKNHQSLVNIPVTNVTILLLFSKLTPEKTLTYFHCRDVKAFNSMNSQSLVKQKLTSQKWSHVIKKAFFDVKVEVKPVAKRPDCDHKWRQYSVGSISFDRSPNFGFFSEKPS
jgi:hypothetical protein